MATLMTDFRTTGASSGKTLGQLLATAILCATLGACSWMPFFGDEEQPDIEAIETTEQKVYARAQRSLRSSNHTAAIEQLELLEARFPFGEFAEQAQLELIYARYMTYDLEGARSSADRFIRLHPGHDSVDYAYYLKALSYYEQISDVSRDQTNTTRALQALQEVVRRFPDSNFARDAKLKLDLTRDHLAGKEMSVARYYQKQGNYLAAINRFKVVIDKYQTTTHAAESLHRLAECYLSIGMKEEALRVASILGHNYPSSTWYSDSYSLFKPKVSTAKEISQTPLKRAWDWLF